MKSTSKEIKSTPIHSLIRDRKRAFSELIRAYLRFNIASAQKVEVMDDGNLSINDTLFKVDISDYTGTEDELGYIFFNPSSGRLLIQKGNVKKIYKLEVDLVDE